MNESDIIRTVTIKSQTQGVTESAAAVKGLKNEMAALGQAATVTATATETSAKRQLSAVDAMDRMERKVSAVARAQYDFERAQRSLNMAVSQNPALQERANNVLEVYIAKTNAATMAQKNLEIAQEHARRQQANASVNGGSGFNPGSANAGTYAAEFEKAAAEQERMIASASALKASIDPLGTAFQRLATDVAYFNKMQKEGHLTQQQTAAATALSVKRYEDVAQSLRQVGTAGRVASYEIVDLTYQLNDVVTGLALGQSPFMILAQQGGQVFQIFQNSKASLVDFAREAGSRFMGLLTASRVAFLGTASVIGIATLALNGYLDAQHKVAMSLTGAGRASGATVGGINSIASAGASTFGLSVSEARVLASALAATGKVANDNILPIVKMGKDIAYAFGVDATEAAKMLAEAFSDPAKGAETLNQRLGFMDAAMQRNIQNLIAQNRTWEAQRVLTAGVTTSLADVNAAVATSTKFWTALGNIISDAWDKVGEGAARVTGIGLKLGLEEQIEKAKKRIEELEQIAERRSDAANKALGTASMLEKERAKLDDLTAAWSRYGQASTDAQQRQFSFAQAAAVRIQQPEIDQIERLKNEYELLVRTMVDVQTTGGPMSDILKRMGMSYEELAKSLSIANNNMKSFKNEFQTTADALKIANDAISAFSPSAKGDIARRQSLESTLNAKMAPEEKKALAEQAYGNAVKQVTVALSEQARQRALTGNQAADSIRLEIDLIGKTIGQQAEMRANLQARQQLEQEASQNRTKFDEAQYQRLKKINEEIGKQTQMAAVASANDNIRFGSQTSLLSPEDAQIAAQLRTSYRDVATALDSVQASGLRTNQALSGLSSTISGTLATGLTDVAMGTKSVSQGFSDMAMSVARSIQEMIIKLYVVIPLMRALQSTVSSLGFGFGGDPAAGAMSTGAAGVGGLGGLYHSGGIVGHEPTAMRAVNDNVFFGAPRFHKGLMPDEFPAILQRGEGVFTRGQMAAMGGGMTAPQVTVNLVEDSSRAGQTDQRQNDNGGMDLTVFVDAITAKNAANPGSATSQAIDNRKRVARR